MNYTKKLAAKLNSVSSHRGQLKDGVVIAVLPQAQR